MPTANADAVMREHEGGRAGSIPGISMPPNHRFSTYRLSPGRCPLPSPFSRYTLRPLLPIIIQLGSAGPGSNGRDALRVLLAACNYLRNYLRLSFRANATGRRWRGTNVTSVEPSLGGPPAIYLALSIACSGVTVSVANSAWAYIGDEWYLQNNVQYKREEKSASSGDDVFASIEVNWKLPTLIVQNYTLRGKLRRCT